MLNFTNYIKIYFFFLFQNYAPTTFNRYISETTVANRRVRFTIWDTAGSREANSTRALACREADVLLLCYRISDPASLFNAINHWVPELQLHAPTTPILLVGCQSDMRTDPATIQALAKVGRSPVSAQQALSMSQQMQAVMYVETSSRVSARGVATVMELAALTALGQVTPPPPPPHITAAAAAVPSGQPSPLPSPSQAPGPPNSRNNHNHHHRQSSLLLLPSSPSASSSSSSSSVSSPSPMISSKKHRNRSLSMTRHQYQSRPPGGVAAAGPPALSRPATDILSSPPVSEEDDSSSGIYAIEPSETFWKQFPSLINSYGTDIILRTEAPQQPVNGCSPLAVRLGSEAAPATAVRGATPADSPRSPLLTARSKMGSLSSMSMRSKSSTLSSTKSDSSMLSINNSRSSSSCTPAVTSVHSSSSTTTISCSNSSSSGGGVGYTSTNLNNNHTISITTRTPKSGRKTPKKNSNGGSGEAEKMIRIKCQRLREEDMTYEEVEIEVPAPVYETMQAYTENGTSSVTRKNGAEKRSGLGTKIKCLFSKTAS